MTETPSPKKQKPGPEPERLVITEDPAKALKKLLGGPNEVRPIGVTCKDCGTMLSVSVELTHGTSHMQDERFACPACGVEIRRDLPGRVRAIEISTQG